MFDVSMLHMLEIGYDICDIQYSICMYSLFEGVRYIYKDLYYRVYTHFFSQGKISKGVAKEGG